MKETEAFPSICVDQKRHLSGVQGAAGTESPAAECGVALRGTLLSDPMGGVGRAPTTIRVPFASRV